MNMGWYNMRENQTRKIALLSVITALSVVSGYYLKIPTPTGIVTFLDVGIFFAAFSLGSKEGALVGALAGFLIDLLSGYPQWMFFSLVFHGLQGFLAGFKGKLQILGLVLATIVMVGGYALASSWMSGWGAALAEVLLNLAQNLFGMLLGFFLKQLLAKQLSRLV